MKIALILTNDWELFGNGSGDFDRLQRKPLKELIDVVREANAKLTIFAELGQQLWGARRVGSEDRRLRAIGDCWEASLREAVLCGVDVQAHLHPAWLHGRWVNGRWDLDYGRQSTGSVDEEELVDALRAMREYLDRLLQPVNGDYKCVCYRAGGFLLEPSEMPLRALRRAGFRADSSVLLGLRDSPYADYRRMPSEGEPWFPGANLRDVSAGGGLVELPVSASSGWDFPILRKWLAPELALRIVFGHKVDAVDVAWQEERNRHLLKMYPLRGRTLLTHANVLRAVVRRLACYSCFPLDYDQLPPAVFIRFVETAASRLAARWGDRPVPVVALGHGKGMPSGQNIRRILQGLRAAMGNDLSFMTVREAVDMLTEDPATSGESRMRADGGGGGDV